MKARISLSLFLVVTCLSTAQDHPPFRVKYVNGKWFDGHAFISRPYYSVGGILHPNDPRRIDQTVDLAGGYVIPACGEAHNHNATKSNTAALGRYVAHGILYVENPENLPDERLDAAVLNRPDGPDVIFANGAITAPGGHPLALVKRNIERGGMTEAQGEGAFYYAVGSAAELESKLQKLLGTKPDLVKIILVYSEDFEHRKNDDKYFSRRGVDPSLVAPLVARVHNAGLRVSAHVESAHDFSVAVRAGVDQIAHMPGFWPDEESQKGGSMAKYLIRPADARLAAKKKIIVITTLMETLERADQSSDRNLADNMIATARHNFDLLRRNGVPIAIGSDQFRKDTADEALQLMKHGFLSTAEMLNAWCSLTPRIIFPNRRVGALRDGFEANFSVLRADPLSSPEALVTLPQLVFKRGKLIGGTEAKEQTKGRQ